MPTHTRTIAAAVGVAVAAVLAASVAGPAHARSAAPAAPELTLTPIGTYATGAFDEGASEIIAHDVERQRALVVNAHAGTVDVLDISDPAQPAKVATLDTPGANSVAVHGDVIAVAEQAPVKQDPGTVSLFDAVTLTEVATVLVGALPDMVTITRDGSYAVVANEGEPAGYLPGQVDPEGSISVIDLRQGPARATVRTADFAAYDGQEEALRARGVRIFGPGATASQDLEPEYVATSTNGQTAWVTLQENNAIATVDLRSATVTAIHALGSKDHSVDGNGLDASDKDGGVAITTWPVKGLYLPDGLAAYAVRGQPYLVTANEGDAREYDGFEEELRVKDATLDHTVFPTATTLKRNEHLGRLKMTSTSPAGPGGYTEINTFGTRSISVRDAATGELVWDSGDAFERLLAERDPASYNATNDEQGVDNRSDDKGPEPEGVTVGKLAGRTYAFVGLERNGGIVAVDVTDPRAGRIAGFATNRDAAGDPESGTAGDLGPEGIHFVAADVSPNGMPLLLVGNETSGTTTLWQVEVAR